MKRITPFVLLLAVLTIGAFAETTGFKVTRQKICTAVESRSPVNSATSFVPSVDRLYCFTRLEGAPAPTTVTHAWFHGDQLMAEIELSVRASGWRTWSSKRILPHWTGEWKVEVRDAEGKVLRTENFTVKAAKAATATE